MQGAQIQANQASSIIIEENPSSKMLVLSTQNSINSLESLERIVQANGIYVKSSKQRDLRPTIHSNDYDQGHLGNDWTAEENEALFKLFQIWGSRWTKISHQINGKSQNCVKNRFYGSLRKALRRMNRAAKGLVKKFKKEVKYESITRIIDAAEGLFRLHSPLKEQSQQLSRKILSLAQRTGEEMPSNEAEELIVEINKFNMATRSYKSKKKIKYQVPAVKKTSSTTSTKTSLLKSSGSSLKSSSSDGDLEQTSKNAHETNVHYSQALNSSGKPKVQTTVSESKNQNSDGLKYFEDDWLEGVESVQSLEQIFTEMHSPLECELWI